MGNLSKRLLWGIITVLLVTNIASILLLTKNDKVSLDTSHDKIPTDVATVGDKKITRDHWISSLIDTYGKEYLRNLINKEVVFQMANEHDLEVNDKILEKELAYMEIAAGVMTEDEREKRREEWIENIKYDIYLDELLTKDIIVSDSDIQHYYNENREDFTFPTSYQISQIMVEDESNVNIILEELEKGTSFAQLANEYSIDPYTKGAGGYLGYFNEESTYLQDVYFQQLRDMEAGSYSEPFETSEGTIILYLHHVLPEIEMEYGDVQNHIRRVLAKQQLNVIPNPEVLWNEVGVEWIYK